MNPILLVAAVVAVYLMIHRSSTTTSTTGTSPAATASLASAVSQNFQNAALKLRSSLGTNSGGPSGVQIGGEAAGIGVSVASSVESSLGVAASSAAGVATMGAGLLIQPIFQLLAAHSARVKGATNENSGVNAIIPACDADFKMINAAYNSGQIDGPTAIQAIYQVRDNYWQFISQFKGQPGVGNQGPEIWVAPTLTVVGTTIKGACAGIAGGPTTVGSKTCTAGCAVGNYVIMNSIEAMVYAIQNPGKGLTHLVCPVYGDKYGLAARPGYNLTWK